MYVCGGRAFLLDAAEDDLAQRIDEGLQDLAGLEGAQHATPQVQTVHVLPVIHRLVRFLEAEKALH